MQIMVTRLVVGLLAAGTALGVQQMLNQRKCDEGPAAPDAPHSVGDWGHRITHSLNDMLHNNTALADIVLIVHSFIYDAIALHMVYVSFTAAKTAKGFVSFAAIVLMRSMAQLAMQLPCPPGYLWHYPGFPSMVVDYEPAADFFFSGHVSFMVMFTVEYYSMNYRRMAVACGLLTVALALLTITCRVHYTADVLAGAAAAQIGILLGSAWHQFVTQDEGKAKAKAKPY